MNGFHHFDPNGHQLKRLDIAATGKLADEDLDKLSGGIVLREAKG